MGRVAGGMSGYARVFLAMLKKARAPENRRPGFIIQYPSSLYIHVPSSDGFCKNGFLCVAVDHFEDADALGHDLVCIAEGIRHVKSAIIFVKILPQLQNVPAICRVFAVSTFPLPLPGLPFPWSPRFSGFTAKASGTGPQTGHPGECDTHIGSNAWWDQSCSDGRIPESDWPPGNHPQNYRQEAMPLR